MRLFSRSNSVRLATAVALSSLVLLVAAPRADAVPITYSFTGIASGTIDGNAFVNEAFSFVFPGDTDNVDFGLGPTTPRNFFGAGLPFSIGAVNGITPSGGYVFNAQGGPVIGWGYSDTFDTGGGFFASAGSYNLDTDFDAVAGAPYNPGQPFISNLGVVSLNITSARFTATLGGLAAAPEPGSVLFLATSLPLLGFLRRRTRTR